MIHRASRLRRWLAGSAAALALAVGAAGVAGAATNGSSSPSGTTASASSPATVTHGPGETLLTGTTAAKVTAAAKAAVPGGTIIRVETDSGGATYEAHMTKSDGSEVTVKVDSNFKVTNIINGMG
jgi:hypothetical protein